MKQLKMILITFLILAFSFGLSISLSFAAEEPTHTKQLSNPSVSNGVTTWDSVEFGTYPQAEVVPSLDIYDGVFPRKMISEDDVIVDSDLYEQLQSNTDWTSDSISLPGGESFSWGISSLNGERYFKLIKSGNQYYFRCEPIKWRVLSVDEDSEQALLLADKTLDNDSIFSIVPRKDNYKYNYVTSRFPNIAFSDIEKETIVKHNDYYLTPFDGSDITENRGFSSDVMSQDSAKQCYGTMFAKRKGIRYSEDNNYYGCNVWSLYEDGAGDPYDPYAEAGYVGYSGRVLDRNADTDQVHTMQQYWIYCGFRPAITISLSSNNYRYTGKISSRSTFKRVSSYTTPIIKSVKFTSNTVNRPGIATLQIDFSSRDTGIVEANVVLKRKGENYCPSNIVNFKPKYNGTIKVDVPLKANMKTGRYDIYLVELKDSQERYINIADLFELEGIGGIIPSFEYVDEYNYQITTDITNPDLADRMSEIDEGNAIRVNLINSAKKIMPKEAFEAIQGRDVTVVAYTNYYQWVFNGKDIVNSCKDIDLSVSINSLSKNDYQIDENVVSVTFAPNGTLPCKTQIRFKSDYLYNLYKVNGKLLLYYDKGGVLELQENPSFDLIFDGSDKWCHFSINHNSRFVISGKSLAKLKNKKTNTLTVKAKKLTLKYSKLKKNTQNITVKKAFTVKNPQGKVTYKVKKYDKKAKKRITVSKSGKVTVKKGLKKGTYEITVNVTAAGTAQYKAMTKTVKLTIKVK